MLKKINELNYIAIGMLSKGFNITKSCVQNDFHQNWEFKFKLKINWKKCIQIRLIAS